MIFIAWAEGDGYIFCSLIAHFKRLVVTRSTSIYSELVSRECSAKQVNCASGIIFITINNKGEEEAPLTEQQDQQQPDTNFVVCSFHGTIQ